MGNFDAAKVIEAAATSQLGVVSLIVLVLAFLAWRFFQRSDDKVKLIAFAVMFLGAAGFVTAVMMAGGDAGGDAAAPEPSVTGSGPAGPPTAERVSSDAGDAPDIAGEWRDSDGYRFLFSQDGSAFTYRTFVGGEDVGGGAGTISDRRLTYRFTDDASGNEGRCEAELAPDARTISGTCGDGSAEWGFAIER